MVSGPKPEHSAYGSYVAPSYGNTGNNGPPYGHAENNSASYGSPQNSYGSPQHSYGSPGAVGATPVEPYAPQHEEGSKSGRRFCGLAAGTLAIIIALIVLLIAATIGGGVGGSIAVSNAKKSCQSDAAVTISSLSAALASVTGSPTISSKTSSVASSATSSSSSSSSAANTATQPWGPVGTDLGQTTCPDSDGKAYVSTLGGQRFKIYCNKDQPGNDLMKTLVTTFGLCMEACASWNQSPDVGKQCAAVGYIPSAIDGFNSDPVDCFLKSVGNATALAANTYVVDYAIIQ